MDRQSSLFLLHGRVFLLAFVLCLCPPTLSAADSGDWEQWLDRAAAEAGDPDFDMAFGLAALEFGHPEQAVFAFERVLMIRPWDHRARLELGRAQLANGNFAAARESFQTVLDAQPPETVARNVQHMLARIEAAERARSRFRWHGELMLGGGADSNVNGATANGSIPIPALGRVILEPGALAQDDNFVEAEAMFTGYLPATLRRGWFGGVDLYERNNIDTDDYDLRGVSLQGGAAWVTSTGQWRLPVQVQRLYVAERDYRWLSLAGLGWQGRPAGHYLGLSAQTGRIHYPDSPTRDVSLHLIEATTRLGAGQRPPFQAAIFLGREIAEKEEGKHQGRDYLGLRGVVDGIGPWKGWLPSLRAVAQVAEHAAEDPVFAVTRWDRFYQLAFFLQRPLTVHWHVEMAVEITGNLSNIGLYDYRRQQGSLRIRYRFGR